MPIVSLPWVAVTLILGLLASAVALGTARRRAACRLEQEQLRRLQAEGMLQVALSRVRALDAAQGQVRADERARIARDIHDDLGQSLLALKIELSMLQLGTSRSQPLRRNKLAAMLGQLDGAIVSLRAIINDLRPAALSEGLRPAVLRQLQEFTRLNGIPHSLRLTPDAFDGIGEHDTVVFRLLQEALSNIARHAQATEVAVTLERHHGLLQLKISDNGVGLPTAASPHGCGLNGMRERTAAVGGQFDVYSRPGAGTLIKLTLPLTLAAQPS